MAHGKTLELISLGRQLRWRKQARWKPQARDRSLRGKARIKARKEANKSAR